MLQFVPWSLVAPLHRWSLSLGGFFELRFWSTGQGIGISGYYTRTNYSILRQLGSKPRDFRVVFLPFWYLSRSGQLGLFL
jgi:hypothetical protein